MLCCRLNSSRRRVSGTATVERTRRQCVPGGLEAAPGRRVQLNRKRRALDSEGEARLTMPACSEPPGWHAQWTLRLLSGKLAEPKTAGHRTRQDFTRALRDIADRRFPDRRTVLVMGSLNTRKLSTLCETFKPEEVPRLAERFEIRHTPKRGSWLNMAETGINVLSRQRLARRIPDRETMRRGAAAWQRRRSASAKPADWRFKTAEARVKLKSLYPSVQ